MKNQLLLLFCFLFSTSLYSNSDKYNFVIGTYTVNTKSEGIYTLHLDMKNSIFETRLQNSDIANPSFLTISKDKKFIYSVSENGLNSGLSSFRFDKKNGSMKFINSIGGIGADPCYVEQMKNCIVTANYTGGSLDIITRNSDGSLGKIVQTIQHFGSSINTDRQTKAHVHQVVFDKIDKILFVNDLGLDEIRSYKYEGGEKENIFAIFDKLKLKPGSGPRHLVLSKNGKYIYLLHELDGTLSVIRNKKGILSLVNQTSIVRKSDIIIGAADIHFSPDNKFLYATNRGSANDITCFEISNDTSLVFVQQISVLGKSPRNFCITKDGRYVLVANQQSDQIVVFGRDKKTGKLIDLDIKIDLASPVCIKEY